MTFLFCEAMVPVNGAGGGGFLVCTENNSGLSGCGYRELPGILRAS